MGLIHAVRKRLDARAMRAREAQRRSMPQAPLAARHVEDARLLPNRLALLDAMPGGMTIAEVGVADGDFSVEILSRCAPERLHLVDAGHTDRYVDGESNIRTRFAAQIAEGKVVIHKGLSTEVLKDLPGIKPRSCLNRHGPFLSAHRGRAGALQPPCEARRAHRRP